MSYKYQQKYIVPNIDGKLFPSFILANFKKYKIPEILLNESDDPCNKQTKLELRKFQMFVSKFLDYRSPYRDILLYHEPGAGKTGTAINVYNILYNYNPGWNVFVILPAALRDSVWMKELAKWLQKDDYDFRFKNIKFISYNSPIFDKQFMEAIRNSDTQKKNMYIIDECHNFIKNVYSNISSKKGGRAGKVYDYIIQDKKENPDTRTILMSGTPAVNIGYELALLFNLLRPGTFPTSEILFNQLFVSPTGHRILNNAKKNLFQRRIMGLVSYVATDPTLYASKTINFVNIHMSDYQQDIYRYFEEIEENMAKKSKTTQSSESYKTYTRQASNFVFPALSQDITGETRPRPSKFRVNEKEAEKLIEGRLDKGKLTDNSEKAIQLQQYLKTLDKFVNGFEDFLMEKKKLDDREGYTILKDFEKFVSKYNYDINELYEKESKKSNLFNAMYMCSPKMLCIIFNIMRSPGPTQVYSNYVLMEGLQIFKVYLKLFGFTKYTKDNEGTDNFRYIEYHGGIDMEERAKSLTVYNRDDNINGKLIKIIMISPAGAEGLSLEAVRQVHIMEPYWHEVRINQMIGRALRTCSHKKLPKKDRHVEIFRYKSVRKDKKLLKQTTDEYIESAARTKQTLIDSFLLAMKEVAIDCELNKNINQLVEDYRCFQFEEQSLFEDEIGSSYKDDINDDIRYDSGSNSLNSETIRIKAYKIKAVIQLTSGEETESYGDTSNPKGLSEKVKYSKPENYWYNPDTLIVYDYELHYIIGKIAVEDDLPKKLDAETFIIDKLIPLPLIEDRV
jgi:hypothetical protein